MRSWPRWLGWGLVGLSSACGPQSTTAEPLGEAASSLTWSDGVELLRSSASDTGINDLYGWTSATNGTDVIVGAHRLDVYTGAAFVFRREGASWVQKQKLMASDFAEYGQFGPSIVMTEDRAVFSCGAHQKAYVFERVGETWAETQILTADDAVPNTRAYASSVAIDGDTIAVGAPYDDDASVDAGAVYVYTRGASGFTKQQKITVQPSTRLGESVALSGDTLLVGGTSDARVFVRNAGQWSEQYKVSVAFGLFGEHVAIDGNTAVVTARGYDKPGPYTGRLHTYERSGTTWSPGPTLQHSQPAQGDGLGRDVAIDGDTIVAGAFNRAGGLGAAYVFTRSGASWTQAKELVPAGATVGDYVGTSVAVSGNTVVVGGAQQPIIGTAYVYEGTCSQDSECPESQYCSADQRCTARRPVAAACDDAASADCNEAGCRVCAAGPLHCVDGVCCEQSAAACSGCSACSASLTGAADGECHAVAAGKDPHAQCAAAPDAVCGADGACDGQGSCRTDAPSGTACGETTCEGGLVSGSVCDGSGNCGSNQASCGPYGCADNQCRSSCETPAECAAGHHCSAAGTCEPNKQDGEQCRAAAECTSGNCVDGVCCNSDCAGQCESCAESGRLGTCVAASGEPRDGRQPCDGQGSCRGSCDGETRDACVFPAAGQSCSSECRRSTIKMSTCDGAGACVVSETIDCTPYGCAPDETCRRECKDQGDCATGHQCFAGRCELPDLGSGGATGEQEPDDPNAGNDSSAETLDDSGCSTSPGGGKRTWTGLILLLLLACRRRTVGLAREGRPS